MKNNYGFSEAVKEALLQTANENGLQHLILFGSRARGDYRERSDIDLAVSGGNIAGFTLAIEEQVPTLLNFDVVNLDIPVQKELLDVIHKEGVILL